MYKVEFTEEELSVILQAISFYEEQNYHFKLYDISNSIVTKIDEIL